jgi:parallel beta-helix repeat protein
MRTKALMGFSCLLLLFVSIVAMADGALTDHKPIVIGSNYEFTEENGVIGGSGTVDDPYIIAGWKIDAGYSRYGISIHRTDRYFVIDNVQISGASQAGIFLSYVENGLVSNSMISGNWIGITLSFASSNRIEACTLTANTDGVHLYFSHDNQILWSVISKNDTGLWLDASNNSDIIGNTISRNYMGTYLDLGSQGNIIYANSFIDNTHNAHSVSTNFWDKDGCGNYWSNWEAIDADKDGIWDSPYVIRSQGDQDNFPLVQMCQE